MTPAELTATIPEEVDSWIGSGFGSIALLTGLVA
jgi:hypothetical protein